MKKITIYGLSSLFIIAVLVVSLVFPGTTVAKEADDIQKISNCPYCGMDRQKFAHSRVLIKYGDGTELGACSLHCAAIDMAINIDKNPEKIMVGDYNTKELIDAQNATWVIGGDKPGVMTKRAKWAFDSKANAEKFVAEHGGEIVGFEEAIKSSYEDMYADTKMIREKRKMMKMKKMQKQE